MIILIQHTLWKNLNISNKSPSNANKELNYVEYRVDYSPTHCDKNLESKKYIGLMFYETDNIDDSCTENNEKYHIFFETHSVYIINYFIELCFKTFITTNKKEKFT